MPSLAPDPRSKVPAIAIGFWVVKILSTTVGETGADFLAIQVGWGQGITSALMATLLVTILMLQLRERRYVPWMYWLCVVLVSVVGTQITDLLTDGLGVSLYASSAAFGLGIGAIFACWYVVEKTLSIHRIVTRRRELFYWAAILCTFVLGTAVGDLATEALGLGFDRGSLVFGLLLVATYATWRAGGNAVLMFWVAYILTRPFGAAIGDLLTQDPTYGGFGIGALWTSAVFLFFIVSLVVAAQLRAGHTGRPPSGH